MLDSLESQGTCKMRTMRKEGCRDLLCWVLGKMYRKIQQGLSWSDNPVSNDVDRKRRATLSANGLQPPPTPPHQRLRKGHLDDDAQQTWTTTR